MWLTSRAATAGLHVAGTSQPAGQGWSLIAMIRAMTRRGQGTIAGKSGASEKGNVITSKSLSVYLKITEGSPVRYQ